jgi:hypothetical protein
MSRFDPKRDRAFFGEMGHDGIDTRKPRKHSGCLGYGYEARFGYQLRLRVNPVRNPSRCDSKPIYALFLTG